MSGSKVETLSIIDEPWEPAPLPVRLPIFGERPIDRAIRDLMDDESFGRWLFGRRDYDALCFGRQDDLAHLFWFLDADSDPFTMSAGYARLMLFTPNPPEYDDGTVDHRDVGDSEEEPSLIYFGDYPLKDVEPLRELFARMLPRFLAFRLSEMGHRRVTERDLVHSCDWSLSPISPDSVAGVYFVRAGNRVKIGKAKSVRKRITELQTASSFQLELLLVLPGGLSEESAIHKRFASQRVVGEWFHLSDQLLEFISAARARQDSAAKEAI